MKTIIAITRQDIWEQAQRIGEYTQSTLDSTLADVGFIHCSFPDQTIEIANRRFGDRDDLVLLLIDENKVKPRIKHEGARSGRVGTFPHIYGPLNIDAVYATVSLKKNDKGEFIAPDELREAQRMNDFSDTVKVMANTPPISNEEIVRRSKQTRTNQKETMNQTDWWQKMFDQKYLDTYLGGLTSDRTKAEVDFIVKAVQLKPTDEILDLACGHGRHSIELAKRGYTHITGIDYSEVFIAKAIEDAKQADVTVRFQRGDMKELAFDGEFNVVLLIYTAFGYFDDRTNKDVLRQIHKSLKPGGRFLMDMVSGETVIERFAQHGVPDPEMGLPKIARQVEMSGILTDEIEWFDADRQVIHSHREWKDKGQKKEYDFYLHVYTMPQFEVMFAEAGFEIEKTWGNYQGEAFGSEGTTGTLILAKKK